MMTEHREFHGRKVRIPTPHPLSGLWQPHAGKIGTVAYAGWDDWYTVHVSGLYLCRSQAHEIEPNLVPKIFGGEV